MAKATIKCAQCDRHLEFGGMSKSLSGSVSQYDATASMAFMLGWKAVASEWRCPDHAA